MKYLVFIFSFVFLLSCNNSLKEIKGEVFGSTFLVKYYGNKDYSKEIDSIFISINNAVSTYQEDSQISIWNNGNDNIDFYCYSGMLNHDKNNIIPNNFLPITSFYLNSIPDFIEN